jgi:hypothetical protein
MKKYIILNWPEIQDYMDHPGYAEECYYDPEKDVWFIPEEWYDEEPAIGSAEFFDRNDCWDAIGGDWEG